MASKIVEKIIKQVVSSFENQEATVPIPMLDKPNVTIFPAFAKKEEPEDMGGMLGQLPMEDMMGAGQEDMLYEMSEPVEEMPAPEEEQMMDDMDMEAFF